MGNNEIKYKPLKSLRTRAAEATLRARRIQYTLEQKDFEIAYKAASPESKADLCARLDSEMSVDDLKDWVKDNTPKTLDTMSYRELRSLGQKHNIPNWSRLRSSELVEILRETIVQPS